MSEHANHPPTPRHDREPEWPTHCELCGTELESGLVDVVPNSDSEHLQTGSPATVIAQDFCPNPDCPGKDSDLANATGHDGST
jgi:hypothetical protein